MRELTYYLLNLAIIAPVLILSFTTNVKPHRHIKGLLAGYLFVSLPFLVWDFWSVDRGVWAFNSEYITGPYIWGLPLEEILFFITVPFAMVYVWGVVKKYVGDIGIPAIFPLIALGALAAGSVWSLIYYWDNAYTRTVAIAALIMIIIALGTRLTFTLRFWVYQLLILGLFLIFNSILTMLPIVTYSPDAIIGFKFGDIPIEDFLYVFTFINLFLFAFNKADQPHLSK